MRFLFNGTDFWGKGLSRNNLGLDRLKAVLARAKIASCTPWKGGGYRFFGWRGSLPDLQAQGFVDGERLLCTVLPPC